MINAHMFWAYGQVSQLETLAMQSFVQHGYRLHVWSYNNDLVVPHGAERLDARQIIDEKLVFKNRVGSYASFSDVFRYNLLTQVGGLYVDTDVIALKSANVFNNVNMVVTERRITEHKITAGIKLMLGFSGFIRNSVSINNNVINCPNPNNCGLLQTACQLANAYPKENIVWAELGPTMLSNLVTQKPDHNFQVQEVAYANPIPYWVCPERLLSPNTILPTEASFLHCYNEVWRWKRVDKNKPFPPNSVLGKLLAEFNR